MNFMHISYLWWHCLSKHVLNHQHNPSLHKGKKKKASPVAEMQCMQRCKAQTAAIEAQSGFIAFLLRVSRNTTSHYKKSVVSYAIEKTATAGFPESYLNLTFNVLQLCSENLCVIFSGVSPRCYPRLLSHL